MTFVGKLAVLFIVFVFGTTLPPHWVGAEEVLVKGTLAGASGHKTSGAVSIVKTDKGVEVRLGEDFSLDGAPGPYLGFGKDGDYDRSSEFSKLGGLRGAQTYTLPAGVDLSRYNEFYVWCKPFKVPLGVAKLTK